MGGTSTDSTIELQKLREEIEKLQKKQDEDKNQNQLLKDVLEELRFTRMEMERIKKKQEEDSEAMKDVFKDINTSIGEIRETLESPKIVKLIGYWEKIHSSGDFIGSNKNTIDWLKGIQWFRAKDKILTWTIFDTDNYRYPYIKAVYSPREVTKVRVRANECKIRKDGKIEIDTDWSGCRFELDVDDDDLTICHGTTTVKYKRNRAKNSWC